VNLIHYKGKKYVCFLDLGFEAIRGKWKSVLLCHLAEGPKRLELLPALKIIESWAIHYSEDAELRSNRIGMDRDDPIFTQSNGT
jgi:hypothetical protein